MMKTKLLPALLALAAIGCNSQIVKQPPSMADYDKYITYVDSIEYGSGDFHVKPYGVCHMNDAWGEFPIEIKKMNFLDTLASGKPVSWIIDHEKAHRFEAIQNYNNPSEWEAFEALWVEKFGEYDPEDFANTYADLRQNGIKSPKQQLIYDYMTSEK